MSDKASHTNHHVIRWLDLMIIAVSIMVAIGGITRLTGSGLSMTDWRLIGGSIPPLSEAAWQEKFELYRGSPQHVIVHPDMTLEGFKGIFWWEYIHRMWGRMLGILFLIPFVYFTYKKYFDARRIKLLLIAFVLGGGQGLLGWFMVQSGLVDKPWVSPVRLTAHLLMALFLLALLAWNRLEISSNQTKLSTSGKSQIWLKWGIPIAALLFVAQFAFGGIMAGMKAAMDFPTFPTMHGQWIPSMLWQKEIGWHNFFENSAFVQFVHRMLGTLVLAVGTWLGWQGYRYVRGSWKYAFAALLMVTWLQFLLGIITVINSLGSIPVSFGTLHQGGAIILTLLLTICMFVRLKIVKS
ncbi:MAG: COX15/CtaA family protein [Verrucomicrobiota bacterium]